MNKKTCLIGMHALFVAGIAAGYVCMYNKMKKSKQNYLDM